MIEMELAERLLKKRKDIKLIKYLGSGYQGASYVVTKNDDTEHLVMKVIECRDRHHAEVLFKEVISFRGFKHNCLPRILECFIAMDLSNSAIYLLTLRKYIDEPRLLDVLHSNFGKKRLERPFIYRVFGSILDLLLKLKSAGYVHMNLHPQNVFIGKDKVFFTDVGCPNLVRYTRHQVFDLCFEHLYDPSLLDTLPIECPTQPSTNRCKIRHIEWCAPEASEGRFDEKGDVWALACMIQLLIHVKELDKDHWEQAKVNLKLCPETAFKPHKNLTKEDEDFDALLLRMLEPNPEKRISLDELKCINFVQMTLEASDPTILERNERRLVTTGNRPLPVEFGERAVRDYLLHNWVHEQCAEAAVVWFAENITDDKSWLPPNLPPVLFDILKLHEANTKLVQCTFEVLRHANQLGQKLTDLSISERHYCFEGESGNLAVDWENADLMTIFRVMQAHHNVTAVQRAALRLFDSIVGSYRANVSAEQAQEYLNSYLHVFAYLKRIGLTRHIIELIRNPVLELAVLGVEYLWKWCIYKPNAELVSQSDILSNIVNLMSAHPEEIRLFSGGPLLILSLTNLERYALLPAVANDIVPILTKGLKTFQNCPDTIWNICLGLQAMLDISEHHALQFMGIEGEPKYAVDGFSVLFTLYKCFYHNTRVMEALMRVISSLMQYDDIVYARLTRNHMPITMLREITFRFKTHKVLFETASAGIRKLENVQ